MEFKVGDIVTITGDTFYKVLGFHADNYPFARHCDSEGNLLSVRQIGYKSFEANKVRKA